jgi:hypothetical protein
MNVEIGTETPIFLFWEYLFRKFGILSLQCRVLFYLSFSSSLVGQASDFDGKFHISKYCSKTAEIFFPDAYPFPITMVTSHRCPCHR